MFSTKLSGFLAILLGMAVAPAAMAVPITFEFSGSVTEVTDPLTSTFASGDIISGSYTFDSLAADQAPPGAEHAEYFLTNFSLTVGSYTTYSTNLWPDGIYIKNDDPYFDQYEVYSTRGGASVGGYNPYFADIFFGDTTATALSSNALLLDALQLTPFGPGEFYMEFVDPQTDYAAWVSGTITNVQTSVVPLPGALIFFLSGLAAMFVARMRALLRV